MKTTLLFTLVTFCGLTAAAQQTTEPQQKQVTPKTIKMLPVKKVTVPTKSLEQAPTSKKSENQAIEPKKTGTPTTKNTEL